MKIEKVKKMRFFKTLEDMKDFHEKGIKPNYEFEFECTLVEEKCQFVEEVEIV